ncbi:LAFA_0E02982g1_1 [Lachancea sp. 'fantastica']|nr:LAFA_0E02982g1_1 [Lachancea sp. 'fantastica']
MDSLSGIEEFFYHRSKLAYHSCFYVAVKFNQKPEDSCLKSALEVTISKFPHLYSNAFTNAGNVVLRPLRKSFMLSEVVERVDFEYLDESFNSHVFKTVTFDYGVERPLWKLLVLKDQRTFVLCTDHLIMDGLSTVAFWKSVITGLNNCDTTGAPENGPVFIPSANLSKVQQHPYEKIPYTVLGLLLWAFVRLMVLLEFVKLDIIGKVFVPHLSSKDFKFRNYRFPEGLLNSTGGIRNDNCQLNLHIPSSKMRLLLKNCKSHKVSFTSLLAAVVAHSLQSVSPSQVEGSRIKISVPINAREAVRKVITEAPGSADFGNFIKTGEFTRDLTELVQLWDTAKSLDDEMAYQRKSEVPIQMAKLLNLIDVEKFVQGKVDAPYPGSTFEITNLGYQTFDCGVDDKYVVEDAFFNEPQGISDVFTFSVVSTPANGLNCWISYPRELQTDLQPAIANIQRKLDDLSIESSEN